jgi:hypothetical protein
MKRLWICAVVWLFTTWPSIRADEPEKNSSGKNNPDLIAPPDESPKEMMLRGCRIADRFDLDGFSTLYDTSDCTQSEKDLAQASIKYAIEASRVELALRDRFGQKAADDFDHAIGENSEEDVRKAEYKVNGDTATIVYPGETEPALYLIRKSGTWKIDMHSTLKALSEADIKQAIKTCDGAAPKAAPLAEKIKKGEYAKAEDAINAFNKVLESLAPKDSGKLDGR